MKRFRVLLISQVYWGLRSLQQKSLFRGGHAGRFDKCTPPCRRLHHSSPTSATSKLPSGPFIVNLLLHFQQPLICFLTFLTILPFWVWFLSLSIIHDSSCGGVISGLVILIAEEGLFYVSSAVLLLFFQLKDIHLGCFQGAHFCILKCAQNRNSDSRLGTDPPRSEWACEVVWGTGGQYAVKSETYV